jgi:hypothetical protein
VDAGAACAAGGRPTRAARRARGAATEPVGLAAPSRQRRVVASDQSAQAIGDAVGDHSDAHASAHFHAELAARVLVGARLRSAELRLTEHHLAISDLAIIGSSPAGQAGPAGQGHG